MEDVMTRSFTIDAMITGPPMMLAVMGLSPVHFGDEIKAKSKAVCESFETIRSI
jgi:hypothetical protein